MNKVITTILLFSSINALAQDDIYSPVLRQIEANSQTVVAYRDKANAQQKENHTGLTPYDPEVEFGYLWGNPSAIGNRKDISVTQSFDFPTVYFQKSKMADLLDEGSEWEYRQQRMELLLRAKTLLIDLTYQNALIALYEHQCDNSRQIEEAYRRKLEEGDATQMDYNNAKLSLTAKENDLRLALNERRKIFNELRILNGGDTIVFLATSFPDVTIPADFNALYEEAENSSPTLQYLKTKVHINNSQVGLSQASSYPKLSVGYMGEFVTGENFQGITFGLSIPLWESKGKVRSAKAAAQASLSAAEDARQQYRLQLKTLYDQAVTLQETVKQYDTLLHGTGETLLLKAFNAGELSLIHYIEQQEYYLDASHRHLDALHELATTMALLTAFSL